MFQAIHYQTEHLMCCIPKYMLHDENPSEGDCQTNAPTDQQTEKWDSIHLN